MTGKGVISLVTRVFIIVGGLFALGGIDLGAYMWLIAPVFSTESGTIVEVRFTKERPFGFEDIPVDSEDPAHEAIPLNVMTYASVTYEFQGQSYKSEISSWDEDVGWTAGDSILLYVPEDEPQYPTYHVSDSTLNEKRTAILAGGAMSLVGIILLGAGAASIRRDRRWQERLIRAVAPLRRPMHRPDMGMNETVYEYRLRGNFFIGGILGGIGLILVLTMIAPTVNASPPMDAMLTVFPMVLGIGLLILGVPEFSSTAVEVTQREVKILRRSITGPTEHRAPISAFTGIRESILEREVPGSLKRHLFREQILTHPNPRFDGTIIAVLEDTRNSVEEARMLSNSLNLPRILFDGDDPYLEYPDGSVVRDPSETDDGNAADGPFPGNLLRLTVDEKNHLVVQRVPHRYGVYWATGLLAVGIAVWAFFGSGIPLIPLGMMGLIIFVTSRLKSRLEILDGRLIVERTILGILITRYELGLDTLDDVVIGHDPRMNMAESVEIHGDGKRFFFGQSAPKDELRWIRDRLRRCL